MQDSGDSQEPTISGTDKKSYRMNFRSSPSAALVLLTLVFGLIQGCTLFAPQPGLHLLSESEVASLGLEEDQDFEQLDEAIQQSLRYYARLPDGRTFNYAGTKYSARAMERPLTVKTSARSDLRG